MEKFGTQLCIQYNFFFFLVWCILNENNQFGFFLIKILTHLADIL